MRKLITIALIAMAVLGCWAVTARRQTRVVAQPDGTVVTLTVVGDEWFHGYVTSDGLIADITPDGRAVYRTSAGTVDVLVHEAGERPEAERAFISSSGALVNYDAVRATSPLVIQHQRSHKEPSLRMTRNGRSVSVEQTESQVPHKGVVNIPIILVEYQDIKFRDGDGAHEVFEKFFDGEGVSARAYFQDASLGQYDPQFKVLGPYTLPQKRIYYGGNDYAGNDRRVREMVSDAIDAADPEADFSIFDNDGDGVCDVVIVLYAGVGEAQASDVQESIWPCQWSLASSKRCDGVRLSEFAVFNELNGSNRSQIDGIGTFCHEFSHCLGLPDFYDTRYGGHFGMDAWSLMDYGSYNNDGYTPVGYSAYEKAFMGWLDLTEGKRATQYTLPVLNDPATRENQALVIPNSRDNNEYFIFENRRRQGWDEFIADEGMMITHVTYSSSAWSGNTVNNYSLQRMTIVPADNRLSNSDMDSDLWPKPNATEFTDESVPAARVNTGTYLSRPITEISRDEATGAVTLWVEKPEKPTVDSPELLSASPGDAPGSFIASWSAVADAPADITYTLQVWPANMAIPLPGLWQDFTADNGLTWKIGGAVLKRSSGIVLGNATQEGSVTSQESIYPEDGEITVAAKAVRYGTDADVVNLVFTLLDENGDEVATHPCEVDRNKGYRSRLFTGLTPEKAYKVRIANRGQKKRATVENVLVFSGDYAQGEDAFYDAALSQALEIEPTAAIRTSEVSVKGERITVSSIDETSYLVTDLTPGETYCYRVKAVPVDATTAFESTWTPTAQVNLLTLGVESAVSDQPRVEYRLIGEELITVPGARLYNMAGGEIPPTSPGRFVPAPGAYILIAGDALPTKVVVR